MIDYKGYCGLIAKDQVAIRNDSPNDGRFSSVADLHWHDLMCAIIEQAVWDWRSLELGKLPFRVIRPGNDVVHRAPLENFFKSNWFERLLEQALPDIDPSVVRAQLHISEPERRAR